MGAGHAHALYVHGHSRVHRLAPEAKVAGTVAFVAAVAVTPREAVWAFGIHAVVALTVLIASGLPPTFVLARMSVVVPFVAFAFLIPFIGSGARVEIWGVAVSEAGLWSTWNILAKATLGILASIALSGTTQATEILRGLRRLRVPATLTMIAAFMIRYLELLTGEMRRMRTAMTARGYDPRWLWQVKPIAASAGSLFIRSYERGERVHAAMLARGYSGAMPDLDDRTATPAEWVIAGVTAATAWTVAAAALLEAA